MIKHTPKYIHTQEDDDFISSLDKMMADDLQVSGHYIELTLEPLCMR